MMGDFTDSRNRSPDSKERNNDMMDAPYSDAGIALMKLKLVPERAKSLPNAFYDMEFPTWGSSSPCTPTSNHLPKLSIPPHEGSPLASHVHEINGLQKFLPRNGEENFNMYACDEFRMFEFKVRRCMRARSHDWTECPFAHPAEKARRRDPRRFHYDATPCSEFRRGSCKKGDACEFSHGVFECWLHPLRYRTQLCKDGQNCKRKVCFFAHSESQLRILPSLPMSHSLHSFHDMLSPTSTLVNLSKTSAFSPPLSPPELSPPRTPEPLYSRTFPTHPSPMDYASFPDPSVGLTHPTSGLCHSQSNFGRMNSPIPPVMFPEDIEYHLMQSLHIRPDSYAPHISSGYRESPRSASFLAPVKPMFSQEVLVDLVSSFHSMDLRSHDPHWMKMGLSAEREFSIAAAKLRNEYSRVSSPHADHSVRQKLFGNEYHPPTESVPVWSEEFQHPSEFLLESEFNSSKAEWNSARLSNEEVSGQRNGNECGYNLPDLTDFDWVDRLVQEDTVDLNLKA